ncbi:MAG TPA: helix-turn-helix domain-containing protein, partial [Syntrophomonas sp.]|nr:helix-turn-helix domain-containing protein [Syntrophomonas sp.]
MEENVKEQCRQKILKAARKLIAEKGAANTTLRNIATEAGVSNGALYYYFHSKDL